MCRHFFGIKKWVKVEVNFFFQILGDPLGCFLNHRQLIKVQKS